MVKNKDSILKLLTDNLCLNIGIEYQLKGLIIMPFFNHYGSAIFNPSSYLINNKNKPTNIYYHDSLKNNGNIKLIEHPDDLKKTGISIYCFICEKIKTNILYLLFI